MPRVRKNDVPSVRTEGTPDPGRKPSLPSSWTEAQRAASTSPHIAPRRPSPVPPSNGVSRSPAATLSIPSQVPSSPLSPPNASIPQRSSSATLAPASVPSTSTTTSTSSVFDDLLSLNTPDPSMQLPAQQMNPWAHLAMQQQAVVSPMAMANASGTPFFEPLASPFSAANAAGTRSVSLQNMPYPPQPQVNPYYSSAQSMGQQAFGPAASLQPLQASATGQVSMANHASTAPQSSTATQAPSNPFGAFAHSMMPGRSQPSGQQTVSGQHSLSGQHSFSGQQSLSPYSAAHPWHSNTPNF